MTVLATAHSDVKNKGTGHEEPMLMVLQLWEGADFSHPDGARCGGVKLRGIHHDVSAGDGVGGYGKGYAESASDVSDGEDGELSRGYSGDGSGYVEGGFGSGAVKTGVRDQGSGT